jgi:hypothetical protein
MLMMDNSSEMKNKIKKYFCYINGEKVILRPIKGKKICLNCMKVKDFDDFYSKSPLKSCKECCYTIAHQIFSCECGGRYSKKNGGRHVKTRRHQNYLNNLNEI